MTGIYNNSIKFNSFNFPNISNTPFRGNSGSIVAPNQTNTYGDNYISNPSQKAYFSEVEIIAAIRSNPEIKAILNEYKIPIKLNMKELSELEKGHLRDTRVFAAKIHSFLPKELNSQVNSKDLQEAAMLHDYGKVLIPASILNKEGSLDESEHKIMELHSELGYQLLRNSSLSENSLNMIRNHHIPQDDIGAQILNVADKYSALTESRCYKKEPMSKEEALAIIYKDVESGLINPEIYNALKKSL